MTHPYVKTEASSVSQAPGTIVNHKMPLRAVLIATYVLQILVAVGIVGYLSFRNGQDAVQDMAWQLQQEITARIEQHVQAYLDTPHLANQVKASAFRAGYIDIDNFDTLQNYLWQQIQVFESITNTGICTADGHYMSVARQSPERYLNGFMERMPGNFDLYSLDSRGRRQTFLRSIPYGDMRQDSWYVNAVREGNPTWGDTQLWIAQELGIGIFGSLPIYDENGTLRGVVNSGLILDHMSDFLRGLNVGRSGETYIVERSGLIIATSTSEKPFVENAERGTMERLNALDSHVPLIRLSAQKLMEQPGTLAAIETNRQVTFEFEDQRYFLQATPLNDERGIDWLIVVAIPESDFMEHINANTRTTIMLSLIALLGANLSGILIARWVVRPLIRLNTAARHITAGDWEHVLPATHFEEMDELSRSFNHMVAQIQASFTTIREAEARFRGLVEQSLVGISIVQEYRIVYLNTALATMFGYTREEATGMPVLETIFPEDRTMVTRRIQERIDGVTKDAHYSFRGTRKDHRVIEVEVHSTRVEFEGKPAVIGTFIDITERRQIEESIRKAHEELEQRVEERTLELSHANTMLSQQIIERERTEEQLQRAREAAEAANHAKSIFLANMSHELRTPLNAILGFAQLLDSRRTSSKEYQDYVRIILRSGEHLLTLINDVLDMSKIEAGRMSLQHTHFDLYRMLDDLHDMFHLRAQEKQLALHVERMTDVPRFIYADEKKLRQVLINLISNAIKFTDEGSVSVFVTIDREHALLTHDQEPYPGEPTSRRSEPVLLRFAVADTGSGIEMHEITTLFEAFAQTTSGQYANEGTGLGLAISRKFVQLMGGDMEVQSQVGGGTTFSFHIIVQTAHGQPTQLHQEKREVVGIAPGQPRYRILVVDDRWDNRHLIVQLLAPLKYEIREASNGQEAVSLCTEWEPDLIFMDMHMPVMDGYEATRRIKAATCGTHPIIIAVTASIFEEERSVMLSAGCNDLLYKPFRTSDFFSMLQKHLDTHYLYADRIPTTPLDKDEPPPLIADSLAHLPHDLVVHLNHAAVLGELDLLTQTLEQIYDNDEVLAAILHEMVEAFQFEHIARLTEEVMNANATKSGSAGRAGTGDE